MNKLCKTFCLTDTILNWILYRAISIVLAAAAAAALKWMRFVVWAVCVFVSLEKRQSEIFSIYMTVYTYICDVISSEDKAHTHTFTLYGMCLMYVIYAYVFYIQLCKWHTDAFNFIYWWVVVCVCQCVYVESIYTVDGQTHVRICMWMRCYRCSLLHIHKYAHG